MDINEDLVGWTSSFLSERSVRMVIGGYKEGPIGISTGLPQGPPVSPPILFVKRGVWGRRVGTGECEQNILRGRRVRKVSTGGPDETGGGSKKGHTMGESNGT